MAPTWTEQFELPVGSYSISAIQDYFENILKEHTEKAVNPSVRKYINKIENRITFKIKIGYYLGLETPEIMKLLGSTKSNMAKNKNVENLPNFEITEVVLEHCHIVNYNYQRSSRLLYTFVPNV